MNKALRSNSTRYYYNKKRKKENNISTDNKRTPRKMGSEIRLPS